MTQPLIFSKFDEAVKSSPNKGHALMRNIDIEGFPGSMKSQRTMLSMAIIPTTRTWASNQGGSPVSVNLASGDIRSQAMIDAGNSFAGSAVTFTTTGTLPSFDFGSGAAPLVAGTTYFISPYSGSSTQFYLYDTLAKALTGGVVVAGTPTANGTGTHTMTGVPMGTIRTITKDVGSLQYYFAYDSNGRVWHSRGGNTMYLLTGNTITAGEGQGLALFKTSDGSKVYLFVFRNALIDIVDVTSDTTLNTPAWTTGWKTMNSGSGSGNSHFALRGQDNIIYYCDDRYVGSIMEIAGQVFDPSNAATFTWTQKALTLPQGEIAYCLEELGVNLLVGGLTYNKIYPWDRVSTSFTLPIAVPEVGVYRMINAGSTVYILAGIKGNVYKTQGTYAIPFVQIPGYVANNSATLPYNVTWGGMALRSGALIAGFSAITTGNSGVYLMYPDGRLLQDNTPYGGSQQVSAIFANNDSYVIGYAAGMDYATTSRPTAGTLVSVYNSELVRVADRTHKDKFSQTEVKLAKPAATGQIRISYRRDTSSSFTTLVTFTCDGNTSTFQSDTGVTDVEDLQIQAEFDGNVELIQITLTP